MERRERNEGGVGQLGELDSGDLDVSADLESVDLIWRQTVRVRSETLAVHGDLEEDWRGIQKTSNRSKSSRSSIQTYRERVRLVVNLQIESDGLLERQLSLAFLISPCGVDKRVANDMLNILIVRVPSKFRIPSHRSEH